MIFKLLLALFIAVPLIDLAILIWIARIHWTVSIVTVIATGVIGAVVLRQQGLAVWRAMRGTLRRGELPAVAFADALMLLFAAGLLITPGFFTDLVGLSILFPWCRQYYRRILGWLFKARFRTMFVPWQVYSSYTNWQQGGGRSSDDQGVIDVEPLDPREFKH